MPEKQDVHPTGVEFSAFETWGRLVEGIRVIKCHFRWARKSMYGQIVAVGKVCVSQRAESDRLVPRRLVDRGAVKGLLTDSDKAELEDTTESKRANDEQ